MKEFEILAESKSKRAPYPLSTLLTGNFAQLGLSDPRKGFADSGCDFISDQEQIAQATEIILYKAFYRATAVRSCAVGSLECESDSDNRIRSSPALLATYFPPQAGNSWDR